MKTLKKIAIGIVLLMIVLWVLKFVFYLTVGVISILFRLLIVAIPVIAVIWFAIWLYKKTRK